MPAKPIFMHYSIISKSLLPLLPYTDGNCQQASGELSSRAAFTAGVRSILLVRAGNVWCSSATGAFYCRRTHFPHR